MFHAIRSDGPSWLLVQWIAIILWAYFWTVQRLAGSLGADELFFSHMFWLMHQGLHQYTDFYSYHLPTYFWMLSPLAGNDVSFVYWLRATSLIAVTGYCAMTRPLLWPFVFMFLIFARMAEIRPDTFGLLLMNAGWFALFKRRTVLGAVLAGLSLFFSARAAVVGVGFALVCLYASDKAQVRKLMLLAIAAMIVATTAFVIFQHDLAMILRAAFLEPGRVIPRMSMATRFGLDRFSTDRLVPLTMITIALLSSLVSYARDRDRDAAIIAGACATQLVLIVFDPAPYEYVYGWAMIPTVRGLLLTGLLVNLPSRALLSGAAAAGAAAIFAGCMFDHVAHHHAPRTQSAFHLLPDLSVSPVERMSTPALVAASDNPGEIWNQVATRRELCRRIKGRVAALFGFQPICLRDATYEWFGVTWHMRTIKRIADRKAAQLLIWGDWLPNPRRFAPGYFLGDGFALQIADPRATTSQPPRR